jgi:hypothetical protein
MMIGREEAICVVLWHSVVVLFSPEILGLVDEGDATGDHRVHGKWEEDTGRKRRFVCNGFRRTPDSWRVGLSGREADLADGRYVSFVPCVVPGILCCKIRKGLSRSSHPPLCRVLLNINLTRISLGGCWTHHYAPLIGVKILCAYSGIYACLTDPSEFTDVNTT